MRRRNVTGGKLNEVPDVQSPLFGKVGEEPLPQEPALASICRNDPSDRPYRAPGPRDFQVSSRHLENVDIVENDSELFASVVSLFPLLDPEKILKEQRIEFGPYVEYLKAPVTASVQDGVEQHESLYIERDFGSKSGNARKASPDWDKACRKHCKRKWKANGGHLLYHRPTAARGSR